MTADVRIAAISDLPITLGPHMDAVDDRGMGAVTSFVGAVRDHDPDAVGEVVALEYTAHPAAAATLRGLAERAVGDEEAIIAVSHRTGRLGVGDAAVVIAVAAPHRDAAFTVCRALIELIKNDLPVWKRQVQADGTTAWKGLGG